MRQWTLNLRDGIFNGGHMVCEYHGGQSPALHDIVLAVELSELEKLRARCASLAAELVCSRKANSALLSTLTGRDVSTSEIDFHWLLEADRIRCEREFDGVNLVWTTKQ